MRGAAPRRGRRHGVYRRGHRTALRQKNSPTGVGSDKNLRRNIRRQGFGPGRKLQEAPAHYERGHPRGASKDGRPPTQHAHPRLDGSEQAVQDSRRDIIYIRSPGPPPRTVCHKDRTRGPQLQIRASGSLRPDHRPDPRVGIAPGKRLQRLLTAHQGQTQRDGASIRGKSPAQIGLLDMAEDGDEAHPLRRGI